MGWTPPPFNGIYVPDWRSVYQSQEEKVFTMKLSRVGVDWAKNIFQLRGVDRHGKAVWRRRLRRDRWLKVLQETVEPGCEIGMEACAGAHHWARELQAQEFTVKLMAPQFVKPYVKSTKNDAKDAETICGAMSRPNMRYVAVRRAWHNKTSKRPTGFARIYSSNARPRPIRSVAWWGIWVGGAQTVGTLASGRAAMA